MLRDLPTPFDPNTTHPLFMTVPPGDPNEHHDPTPPTDHVDPLDDVFGSAPSSPILAPSTDNETTADSAPVNPAISTQHPSDIPRLRSTHVTNGYREGLSESKEKFMQEGFDEGYALGAEMGLKAGWLLGALEGVVKALPTRDVDGSGKEDGKVDGGREQAESFLRKAEEELKIERLCGRQWFGEDGVWLFDVPAKEGGEEDVTFGEVAEAHPVLVKWKKEVLEIASSVELQLP